MGGASVEQLLAQRAGRSWWAPPDPLSTRQLAVLGLLAVAAWTAIFANTLFTQTATFAADSFGVGGTGQAVGGVVVRLGVLITLPLAIMADRRGRRTILVALAWVTPVACAVGALAPSFWALVGTQTLARPLGLAMSLLIGVIAAEEMPRGSRAYALSLIAMSGGFGAGVAVMTLKLADVGRDGWRLVYAIAMVWLVVAVALQRWLPETRRFARLRTLQAEHPTRPVAHQRITRRRFATIATVSFVGNIFVAPVSYFQNRYLTHVRGYSAGGISLFTLITATPASIGLLIGGEVAERYGRRVVLAVCLPVAAAMLVGTYAVSGAAMWVLAFGGAVVAGVAYPAFAVYRSELAPTADRGRSNGWFTVAALAGGSVGLVAVGWAVDHGWSYWTAMAVVGTCQLVAAVTAAVAYPETARLSLEELNPGDAALDQPPG